jgi:hypothetical protein
MQVDTVPSLVGRLGYADPGRDRYADRHCLNGLRDAPDVRRGRGRSFGRFRLLFSVAPAKTPAQLYILILYMINSSSKLKT